MKTNENKFVGLFSLPRDTLSIFAQESVSPILSNKIMDFGDAAYGLENVLTFNETRYLRQIFESNPQVPVDIYGKRNEKLNVVGSYRSSFYSERLASILWGRIVSTAPPHREINEYSSIDNFGHFSWKPVGLNPLFRMIGYRDGGYLLPHYDSGYDFEDGQHYTLMSIILYLDADGDGGEGETRFLIDRERHLPTQYRNYADWDKPARDSQILYRHNAKEGSGLCFDHRLLHEATPSTKQRIVLRSDVIFQCLDSPKISSVTQKRVLPFHESLGVYPGAPPDVVDQAAISKPPENLLPWKVLRDPIYGRAYEALGNVNDLMRSGFIDHDLELESISQKKQMEDPCYLVTPTYKIESRLKKYDSSCISEIEKPLVVLLTTGGFCPIHPGHVEMMEIAKKTLEARGMRVLGGYISPSHDVYIDQKCAEHGLKIEERLSLCEDMLHGHEWLMVDPWESTCHKNEVNFTEVILRLGKYLSANLPIHRPIRIGYVFGGDNARFSLAFSGMPLGICVPRQGYDHEFQEMMNHPLLCSSQNMIFATDQKTSNISSSDLRGQVSRETQKSLKLFVRDEEFWALSHWEKLVSRIKLEDAQKNFVQALFALLTKHCKRAGVHIGIESERLSSQKEMARSILHNKNVISLDPCLPGNFQFEISRSFEISSRAGFSKCVARPGAISIQQQIQKIPAGEFVLFDDDMATQSTMKFAMGVMPEHIKINEYITLRKANLNVESGALQQDCADVRDFMVGSRDSGLVVKLPGGKLVRAPYVLPYVYPSARVSLPKQEDYAFSLAIWKLNLEFFNSLSKLISVKDATFSFRELAHFIGFKDGDSLASICEWHIEKLNCNI